MSLYYSAPAPEPSAASTFYFTVSRACGVVVVAAHGCLDVPGSDRLQSALVELIDAQGELDVILDAHDLSVTEPWLLGILVAPAASIARGGGLLSIADPSIGTFVALDAIGLGENVARSPRRALAPDPDGERARRRSMAQHPSRGPAALQSLPRIPPERDRAP